MKTPPVSSTANEFVIPSPRLRDSDLAGSRVDPADDPLRRREPDPPVPVGQRGDDPVALRHDAAEVVIADELEARAAGLGDDEHVARRGRRDYAVAIVEIEVAAAREVAKRVGAYVARRQVVGREHLEARRVHHRHDRPVEADAEHDDAPLAVETRRGAFARRKRRVGLDVVAERPAPRVGVGLVGVGVDVAEPVRGHVGVARDLGGRRPAWERRGLR